MNYVIYDIGLKKATKNVAWNEVVEQICDYYNDNDNGIDPQTLENMLSLLGSSVPHKVVYPIAKYLKDLEGEMLLTPEEYLKLKQEYPEMPEAED